MKFFKVGDLYFAAFRNALRRDNELNKIILDALQMQADSLPHLREEQLVDAVNKVLLQPFLFQKIDDGRIHFTEKAKRVMVDLKKNLKNASQGSTHNLNKKLLMEIYPEETYNIPASYYIKNFINGKKVYTFCALSAAGFAYLHFKRGLFSVEFTVVMIWLSILIALLRSTVAEIRGHKMSPYV